jgi:hypothetical protein
MIDKQRCEGCNGRGFVQSYIGEWSRCCACAPREASVSVTIKTPRMVPLEDVRGWLIDALYDEFYCTDNYIDSNETLMEKFDAKFGKEE